MSLTNHIKRERIAAAHTLHPIVIIGNQGLTEGIITETHRALYDHELIKVRIPYKDKAKKITITNELCHLVNAEFLRMIGNIIILYRSSDKNQKKKPKINYK